MRWTSGDDEMAVDVVEHDLQTSRLAGASTRGGDIDESASVKEPTDRVPLDLRAVGACWRLGGWLHAQQHTPVACEMQVTISRGGAVGGAWGWLELPWDGRS